MKIIVDIREHSLFEKCQGILTTQPKPNIYIYKEVLDLGDILFKKDDDTDLLLIERKSFSDLVASIKDGRYEEQSYRLLNSGEFPPHSIFYLIEGMFSQLHNPADKKIILSAMTTLQFFKGFSVYRTASVSETAEWILHMADKIERELTRGNVPYYMSPPYLKMFSNSIISNSNENVLEPGQEMSQISTSAPSNYCTVVKKVKKDNITPENIGEIILCQIPGISSVTAIAIMKQFNNFPHFIEELNKNPACLDCIVCENKGKSRKINKSSIENIQRFLLGTPSMET
jgi:ERCC4-type nuclease